ncbi:hypothetical protein LshimejAT787_0603380 [Lyophyllum shimeji]|uniref:Uncharacterized protein n=1 Tax=Lyophyllum shimeji TaxID=47721 RepID=A0A9P3UQF6_LYOSH|nr:hypothetical protein LshimejAT787_0603380 [Lyophyllum shimeji]
MIFCSSRLATTICLMLLAWIWYLRPVFATDAHAHTKPPGNDTHPGLTCTPFGACEPCPESALSEPFCQPFGNRRLMHCVNETSSRQPSHEPISSPYGASGDGHELKAQHPEGETPAWESCGRIVAQERADFYEFLACNTLFAIIALLVLFARSKRLHAMQARQLAARIGIIRGTGGYNINSVIVRLESSSFI